MVQMRSAGFEKPPRNYRLHHELHYMKPENEPAAARSHTAAFPLEDKWDLNQDVFMADRRYPRLPNQGLRQSVLCFLCAML